MVIGNVHCFIFYVCIMEIEMKKKTSFLKPFELKLLNTYFFFNITYRMYLICRQISEKLSLHLRYAYIKT